ncbi:MAG: hypothetical protein U0804_16980 [Gemmataceae bacterium]
MNDTIEEAYARLWLALEPLAPRKQLLAYVAFARRFEPLLTNDSCLQLLDTAERVADGDADLRALSALKNEYFQRFHGQPAELDNKNADYIACELGFFAPRRLRELSGQIDTDRFRTAAGGMVHTMLWWLRLMRVGEHQREWFENELVSFLATCHDLGGKPTTEFNPRWVSTKAQQLATGMYESRDFGPMPVLADALEDAGCADADVLGHCRGPGPHVRGCWVVDLSLGKE